MSGFSVESGSDHPGLRIICVNDGSRDGSLSILERYANEYSNIRIVNKENVDVITAQNAALPTEIWKPLTWQIQAASSDGFLTKFT